MSLVASFTLHDAQQSCTPMPASQLKLPSVAQMHIASLIGSSSGAVQYRNLPHLTSLFADSLTNMNLAT